ncbi:hypothetical protein FVE85_3150 [Porphyridium purpureum]|uniref:Uncharacterized protein n=1 Tax=Porphyridium purpureum TaxID=35688 RepID=A0A5J4YTS7_PORPP|nr:hypothetical protein FVE85_3150 [Porphyridium purpureum]|eukprot:POR3123..scf227_4
MRMGWEMPGCAVRRCAAECEAGTSLRERTLSEAEWLHSLERYAREEDEVLACRQQQHVQEQHLQQRPRGNGPWHEPGFSRCVHGCEENSPSSSQELFLVCKQEVRTTQARTPGGTTGHEDERAPSINEIGIREAGSIDPDSDVSELPLGTSTAANSTPVAPSRRASPALKRRRVRTRHTGALPSECDHAGEEEQRMQLALHAFFDREPDHKGQLRCLCGTALWAPNARHHCLKCSVVQTILHSETLEQLRAREQRKMFEAEAAERQRVIQGKIEGFVVNRMRRGHATCIYCHEDVWAPNCQRHRNCCRKGLDA